MGVIDNGKLVQLATATELLRSPANAMVAALTGANVLDGEATPAGRGSIVRINGGGSLESATPAQGPVHVAVYPWELRLCDPGSSRLTDSVLSVRSERGGLLIALTRFTVHLAAGAEGQPSLAPGATVGVGAVPADVRVLAPDGSRDRLASPQQRRSEPPQSGEPK